MAFVTRESKGSALTCAQFDELGEAPPITQSSHGLSVGEVVKESSLDTYTKATGDTWANLGKGGGLVVHVSSVDKFVLLRWGAHQAVTITGHGLGSFGQAVWLSDSVAGALTATEPEPANMEAIYCAYVKDANTIMWEPGR